MFRQSFAQDRQPAPQYTSEQEPQYQNPWSVWNGRHRWQIGLVYDAILPTFLSFFNIFFDSRVQPLIKEHRVIVLQCIVISFENQEFLLHDRASF